MINNLWFFFFKDVVYCCSVTDIGFVEFRFRINVLSEATEEIIDYDDFIPGFYIGINYMAADESGSASHNDLHNSYNIICRRYTCRKRLGIPKILRNLVKLALTCEVEVFRSISISSMSGQYQKIVIWTVVVVVVLATAVLIVLGITQPEPAAIGLSSSFVSTTAAAVTSTDHVEGNTSAKVSVIEYGDFQCPACGAYFPITQQIIANYGDKIAFVFRNYPLEQHADAQIASQAAEAAGLQGKYWQMHDMLYEDQNTWTNASPSNAVSQFFDGYASSTGINVAQFDKDINSAQVLAKIQNDLASGNAAAINHTPTFFINLKQIQDPTSYDQFKSVIDQALSAAGS
jgi:protein-disulfide isomerase